MADRTAYDYGVRSTASWSPDQRRCLLIYSLKLKSAFYAGSRLLMSNSLLAVRCVLWLNDIEPTVKVSANVNRKCRPSNTVIQLSTPTPTLHERHNAQHVITDRQTDRRTDRAQLLWCQYTIILCISTIDQKQACAASSSASSKYCSHRTLHQSISLSLGRHGMIRMQEHVTRASKDKWRQIHYSTLSLFFV